MKRTFLLIVFSGLIITTRAQDTCAFRKDLRTLIIASDNEFRSIQGALEYQDSLRHKIYFRSGITLGSNDHFIQQLQDENGIYRTMICTYNLTETAGLKNATGFLPVILDELNVMSNSGKYKENNYTEENGTNVRELKDTEGNRVIELASAEQSVILIIYAKSWGKR